MHKVLRLKTYFGKSNKVLHCDLENKLRSLVFELDLGLVGIHPWCKFGEIIRLKEVIMVTRFVKDARTDAQTHR